jgi:two-component system OmpR family sensor kinase
MPQQRVFEPFFRIEASRNCDTGGIGLGLTTLRAIALDYGGQVERRNRKEGGLRVIVSLSLTGQYFANAENLFGGTGD